MAPKCSICIHPKRQYINRMVMNHKNTNRIIAAKYDVSQSAVRRHKEHLDGAVAKAMEEDKLKQVYHALEEFMWLVNENKSQYAKADERQKPTYLKELRILWEKYFGYQVDTLRYVNKDQKDVSGAVEEIIKAVFGT